MKESIEDMTSPVRCAYCNGVYDLGTVEITGRYADCTLWTSPCCRRTVDDRGETGWKTTKDYYRITDRYEVRDQYGRPLHEGWVQR
jgi:hypothetical protein